MPIITSPEEFEGEQDHSVIFLAGGISNCPDWQSPTVERILAELPMVTVINPRRLNWLMDHKSPDSTPQILWEDRHLKASENILFWFPEETLCPITLFELGKYLRDHKSLFIGVHPNYQRKLDVEVQVGIERPNQTIHYDLDSLVEDFISSYSAFTGH